MENSTRATGKTFNMNYAPHHGHFANHAGENLVDEIAFMHEQGFRAIEDNKFLGRPTTEQNAIGARLEKLGMSMGVFVVDAGAVQHGRSADVEDPVLDTVHGVCDPVDR